MTGRVYLRERIKNQTVRPNHSCPSLLKFLFKYFATNPFMMTVLCSVLCVKQILLVSHPFHSFIILSCGMTSFLLLFSSHLFIQLVSWSVHLKTMMMAMMLMAHHNKHFQVDVSIKGYQMRQDFLSFYIIRLAVMLRIHSIVVLAYKALDYHTKRVQVYGLHFTFECKFTYYTFTILVLRYATDIQFWQDMVC